MNSAHELFSCYLFSFEDDTFSVFPLFSVVAITFEEGLRWKLRRKDSPWTSTLRCSGA